jgi:D-alanine transaminase
VIVYLDGRFLPKTQAAISVDDRGFLFADGVYEVIRSYHDHLFRLKEHERRLLRGMSALRISTARLPELSELAHKLLSENHLDHSEALVYLQITRGAPPTRTHAFPETGTTPTIYAAASPFTPPLEKRQKGIAAITVPDIRWARCDLKTIGLLPNCLAKQQALENGADEAIFVRDGVALEGSSCNLLIVKDGVVLTNSTTNYILAGITRQVVIELCQQQNITLHESPILVEALEAADEIFITHTTGEIVPVVRLNRQRVSNGAPGVVTRRLQAAFTEMVTRASSEAR